MKQTAVIGLVILDVIMYENYQFWKYTDLNSNSITDGTNEESLSQQVYKRKYLVQGMVLSVLIDSCSKP